MSLVHESTIVMDMHEGHVILDDWEKARSASLTNRTEDEDAFAPGSSRGDTQDVPDKGRFASAETAVDYDDHAAIVPSHPKYEDDEENVSVWSQTRYGPLDWDHSGDEFNNIKVKRKITRRRSSMSPKDKAKVQAAFSRAVTPTRQRREPSVLSLSKPHCTKQGRDAHGRFVSKDLSPSPPKDHKKTPVPPEPFELKKRKSSTTVDLVPEGTPITRQRDAKGRFAKVESSPERRTDDVPAEMGSKPDESSISVVTPAKQIVGRKRAPVKSPYFTPPITPLNTRKKKATKGADDPTIVRASPSQPQKHETDEDCRPSSQETARKRPAISCIPFPPLTAPYFGLIQEKFAHDPFRLLIAVTFLNRTHGKLAIPVFFELMEKYPTPESLVAADKSDIVPIIRHLGLQNQRASTYQTYAQIWLENPPEKHKRYPVRGYPTPACGKDVARDEVIPDHDIRSAWEIGHMTSGPYALDSWRIFCRDLLRGVAEGWNGEGAQEEGFQPEWMRVLPEDKELRAYLRWMWLKEGFEWDPFTGEKDVAGSELMKAAMEGRIAWDDEGGMRILDVAAEAVSPGLSQLGHVDLQ